MTSFNLNHLLTAPTPSAVTLGVKAQASTYELAGGRNNSMVASRLLYKVPAPAVTHFRFRAN